MFNSDTETDMAPPLARPALYGDYAAHDFAALTAALEPHLDAIVDQFYTQLAELPDARHIIHCLSADELRHLKDKQKHNILLLCSAALTEQQHESVALRVGRIHALSGLNRATLTDGHELLQSIILHYVDASQHVRALSILYRRLLKELAWQLHAIQDLQHSYQQTLHHINALAWSARSYIDLITQTADLLARSDGILGCAFLRPDEQHLFTVEALSGPDTRSLYERIDTKQKAWLMHGQDPTQPGPTLRAWKSRRIERCLNYASDESISSWRSAMQSSAIRSSATIPLVSSESQSPAVLLVIYAQFPGGFSSREQDAFLTQVQSLLVFGINRMESWNALTHTVPYFIRSRWRALMETESLEMHYQPVVDLNTGRTTKVEALARLRDDDHVLTPGQFFPALSSDDFFLLYERGLNQVLKQRAEWLASGIDLEVAVNLPSAGLTDMRYVHATASALKKHDCPPAALTLEILETEELAPNINLVEALDRYLVLGLTLAEDDLGSGYSSLSRLREIPFQVVKIDRSLIYRTGYDSFNALRFVYQLTRLGHNLGKKVVVEGVEDDEMLEAVALLGADYVQGYVIAKPMPAGALAGWLASQRQLPLIRNAATDSNPLVKLACLLTWEEEMHLLLDGAYPLPTNQARLRDMCDFIMNMPLAGSEAMAAKTSLISNAIASGLRSNAYVQARETLITVIFTPPFGGESVVNRPAGRQ